MKSAAVIGGILLASLAGNGLQYYQNTRTQFLLDVETKRSQINEDQIAEFILSRRNGFADDTSALEFAKMQGRVDGIASVIHNTRPQENEISAIWHNGYQRGLEQTDFVGEMKYEQGYAQGFQRGTNENMKAIQTILKSGDNIQSAIKNFVDEQAKKIDINNDKKDVKPQDMSK